MGFFSFRQELAMDLGTANTIIISDDKIVVDGTGQLVVDESCVGIQLLLGGLKLVFCIVQTALLDIGQVWYEFDEIQVEVVGFLKAGLQILQRLFKCSFGPGEHVAVQHLHHFDPDEYSVNHIK